MSADNWRICPNCLKSYKDYLDAKKAKLQKRYGKIDPDKFIDLMAALKAKYTELEEDECKGLQTMREDHLCNRVGTDGEYEVCYKALCVKCGFEYKYEYSQKLELEGTDRSWGDFKINEEPRYY